MNAVRAALVTGSVAALLALPATPASAECVEYTNGDVIAQVYWPVRVTVLGPGTVSVTPTDCL